MPLSTAFHPTATHPTATQPPSTQPVPTGHAHAGATAPPRTIFSGIKPTGHLTLGNHLGALRRFVDLQEQVRHAAEGRARCIFAVVDLHGLTVDHDPARLRQLTRETAMLFLAAGLDPAVSVLVRQSDVSAHTELAYLLECTAYTGELSRMIQFKEKGRGRPETRVSLYTYPVLMAADILLYRTTEVPVGDDQAQHLELSRDLATRFNRRYGEVFVVPETARAEVAARVMDLQQPTTKMSKEAPDDAAGTIRILDPPDVVRRKVRRAVTDTGRDVRHDLATKPGVSNLLEILAGCLGEPDPAVLADRYTSYGALKNDVAEAVVAVLEPVRRRYADFATDPGYVDKVLRRGAERASALAAPTLAAARAAIGLS